MTAYTSSGRSFPVSIQRAAECSVASRDDEDAGGCVDQGVDACTGPGTLVKGDGGGVDGLFADRLARRSRPLCADDFRGIDCIVKDESNEPWEDNEVGVRR